MRTGPNLARQTHVVNKLKAGSALVKPDHDNTGIGGRGGLQVIFLIGRTRDLTRGHTAHLIPIAVEEIQAHLSAAVTLVAFAPRLKVEHLAGAGAGVIPNATRRRPHLQRLAPATHVGRVAGDAGRGIPHIPAA